MKNTIVNTKESKVTVESIKKRNNKKCKPVFNITTGVIYASVADAAIALKASTGNISMATTGKIKTVKGNRLCYITDIIYHIEEISSILSKYYDVYNRFYDQYEMIKIKEEYKKAEEERKKAEEEYKKAKALLVQAQKKENKLKSQIKVG